MNETSERNNNQQSKASAEAKMKWKIVNKQANKARKQTSMQANKLKANTIPTLTLTVQGPDHVK